MKRFFLIVGVLTLIQSCIVTRLGRPKLTGYIYDNINKLPIDSCKVGERYTNSEGYYELKEKRYLDLTFIGMEAPPLFIQEVIVKKGFISDTIKRFSTFGGAARRGTHWKIDTVFLERNE